MDVMDTETRLALVSSLLSREPPPVNDILDTLVRCDGDVQKAAQLLESRMRKAVSPISGKRKRARLDDWLLDASGEAAGSSSGTKRTLTGSIAGSQQQMTTKSGQSSPSKGRRPKSNVPQLPPLMLATPSMVESHIPCTLHLSVLPPELACRLFYILARAARNWTRNKWWLFDKLVESPHRTAFFVRNDDRNKSWKEAAQFWYNGRKTDPPEVFPSELEEACQIVEQIVNEQLRRRERFPLEWGGDSDVTPRWNANVAASNCYQGSKESVGFHSDQMTYLGPYPTIASLSLGTQRIFSLREVIPTDQKSVRRPRTFNIPLPHNSLTIMHASCQEKFKHSVPPQSAMDLYRPLYPEYPDTEIEPSNCRINITFRFYRPDFQPESIPRCKCGVPMVLRADMKNRTDGKTDRYWWACYAGAQNEGKGCNLWKLLEMKAEGRGPCIDPHFGESSN